MMTRRFALRDAILVKQLQDRGVHLDLEGALLQPQTPLAGALVSRIPFQGNGLSTYVLKSPDRGLQGFAQARDRRNGVECDLIFMAPALDEDDSVRDVWSWLIDDICALEGARGTQRIFAKVPEVERDTLEAFQEARFNVYVREEILRLAALSREPTEANMTGIRRQQPGDDWWLQRLYFHIAPPLVRQTEELVERSWHSSEGWLGGVQDESRVLELKDEVVGYLRLIGGHRGHWMKLLIHPDAQERAVDLVAWGLARVEDYPRRPIYSAVRSYEVGSLGGLQRAGFEHFVKRSLLVRHTTARVRQPLEKLVTALKNGAQAAPTVSRAQGLRE